MARRNVEMRKIIDGIHAWCEGYSLRKSSRSSGMDRNTLRKYLAMARRCGLVREHPFEEQELADKLRILRQIRYKTPAIEAIAAFKDDIEGWIKEPSFTIKRIWQRLATEPGVSVAYASVRRYLKRQFPVETHAVTLRLTATPKCIRSVIRGNVSLARLTASADSWICRKVRNRNDEQWIKKLMRGTISLDELGCDIGGRIPPEDIAKLHECALNRPVRYRNRAVSILALLKGISRKRISEYLLMARKSVNRNYAMYRSRGVEWIISDKGKKQLKEDDPAYVDKVFSILHSPPSSFGFNRTSWRQADIKKVLEDNDMPLSKHGIRSIISKSGFKYRKAKTVLTSNDPEYKAKLQAIKTSLANLGPREKFFSIDEYGPFAVKLKGGTSLVPAGTLKTVPQWQKSKGCMILTAALELSTNQVTHFYSKRKNTAEMIRLLDILLEKYADEERIYFSWDAASWHASKELYKRVDTINSDECRSQRNSPLVKLAPLPSSAQFLNVIESVFSGMAKAIIHNSDYQSVDECQSAIDRYFHERNEHFKKHPKRAGNRIWGRERVEATFKESNNCKDPMYR